MDGLSSQVAIEEFLKQGVHNRVATRAAWPTGNLLVIDGEGVSRSHPTGVLTELTEEDLDANDWMLNEDEFL